MPQVIEKYGVIPTGSARALIVLFKEFGFVIYPAEAYNLPAGPPFDISNPDSTGVLEAVYEHEGVETAVSALVGNLTMADLDTSVLISAFDLNDGLAVIFVQNAFKDVPQPAVDRLRERAGPRADGVFESDLEFIPANYFLTDVAAATSAVPIAYSAKPISPVGQGTAEILAVDGGITIESPALISALFAAGETGSNGFESIAIMSLGSGVSARDWSPSPTPLSPNGW